LIADAFLAFLAIVVVMASGRKPEDLEVKQLKGDLQMKATGDFASLLDEVEIGENWVKLVFTDRSLSFQTCEWDLPDEKQHDIHRLFSWIGEQRDLLRQIRIEGHSDKRWEGLGCPEIGPFLDNLQLSQNRARGVYNVLLGFSPVDRTGLQDLLNGNGAVPAPPDGLGYLRDMAQKGHLQVAGYGDRKPRDNSVADSPKNRRVEVVLEFREPRATGTVEQTGVTSDRGAAATTQDGN
jgi:flagellar motor protein MotB